MLFTGTFEHRIDAKQRLAIPAEIRDGIRPERDGDCFYAVIEDRTLCIYTRTGFERRAEALENSPLPPAEVLEYERLFFSSARRVEMDKQGRVRLPELLLNDVGLESDVVLLGVKDHLELHNREQWYAHRSKVLIEKPGLMTPMRLMSVGREGRSKTED